MSSAPYYSACTSILVGKNASLDGSIMIGRNEDAKAAWPKHLKVFERRQFETPQLFKSNDNGFKLPLPKTRFQYESTPEWTDQYGRFEEDGFNEYGVAMSATESTYANATVLGYDPLVSDGIGEEAMVTVILPYVKTARQAVRRLGTIIEKYGTCESNGILFADNDEAWYMDTGSGHHWVAIKIPDDCYAVVSNQMAVQEIDFDNPADFMWSSGIREFVAQHHLNPSIDGRFNFRQIFGTHSQSDTYYNTPRVWYGQRMFNPEVEQSPTSQEMPMLRKPAQKISIDDAQAFLSSHFQETPYDPIGSGSEADKKRFRPISLAKTQESHVLQLRPNLPKAIGNIHWLAMGVAAQSTYVPFLSGITTVPDEYQIGAAEYDAHSAYWIFKLAGVLVDPHYLAFGDLLMETKETLSIKYRQLILSADRQAVGLSKSEAIAVANDVSNQAAQLALNAYRKLTAQLITQSTDLSPLNYKQDLNL
ncbi:C69 family dipeptidase [Lactobacillus sp. Sy-1]|uniref:C69 family dipeptidase n=1 Tax=Lactobacillus sp. Sy-1 TaxID=2109645 RepID=UPI001C56299C|nr:C69 family dipeptidase [Lactobacillus sp. Sy-1]MBW1605606.1 C69 family dipeptidase [Lactobacillus sp. Sy-1]